MGEIGPRPDVVAAMDHRPGGDSEGERGHRVVVQARRDHDRASLGRVRLRCRPVAPIDGQERQLGQRDGPGRLGVQALPGLGRRREGRPSPGDVTDQLLAHARDDERERPERAPFGLQLHADRGVVEHPIRPVRHGDGTSHRDERDRRRSGPAGGRRVGERIPAASRHRDPAVCLEGIADEGEPEAGQGRGRRVALERVAVEPVEPATLGGEPPAPEDRQRELLEEDGRAIEVARLEDVAERLLEVPVRLAPVRRPELELRPEARLAPLELVLEHRPEERVVAVPLALVVERDEEQVGPLDRAEHRRRAAPADDRVAQRGAQPVEDRRPGEEPQLSRRERRRDLGAQVVLDVPIAIAERGRARGRRSRRPGSPARRGTDRPASPRSSGRARRPRPWAGRVPRRQGGARLHRRRARCPRRRARAAPPGRAAGRSAGSARRGRRARPATRAGAAQRAGPPSRRHRGRGARGRRRGRTGPGARSPPWRRPARAGAGS